MDLSNAYSLWPGWRTVCLIGSGSFGAVYEIERNVFGEVEKAALKVITIPQHNSDIEELLGEGYDRDSIARTFKGYLQNIVNEYSLMRKMNGGANVVNCDDVRCVQHDDKIGWDVFIKMELLTPLIQFLPERVSEEQTLKIGIDICRALVLCKKHGIVHRDIKPQNIFVSQNGDYKLGDFGVAKTIEKSSGGTRIGTYKYMAPEVYNSKPYGAGADIYSLGLVLYWLLNEKRLPFLPLPPEKLIAGADEEARMRRLSGESIPAPAHGSENLKHVVLKACAYDPEGRYQSAEEMLSELEILSIPEYATAKNEIPFVPPAYVPKEGSAKTSGQEPRSRAGTRKWIISIAALLIAGAALGVGVSAANKIPMESGEPLLPPKITAQIYPDETEPPLDARDVEQIPQVGIAMNTMSAGYNHTVALRQDGTVVAVGKSEDGQCKASNWTDIIAVSAGADYTVGLKSNGEVVAAGRNDRGQCKVSGWTDIVAVATGYNHTLGLKSDGTVVAVGDNRNGECELAGWTDIVAVAAGDDYSIGLKSDGTVVAMGHNDYGQCDVSGWTDIVAISTGFDFTVGLKSDGTVAAVGNTDCGQCNVSGWTDIVAISTGYDYTVGLKSDGTMVAAGNNNFGQCNVSGWSDIAAISAGFDYTVVLKPDGTAVAIGDNDFGQCNVSGWAGIMLPRDDQG